MTIQEDTDLEEKNKSFKKNVIRVTQDWIPEDYVSIVDESITNISFKPDKFQQQAFYLVTKGYSVFVAAHTSSGKTLVAEYAIFLAQKRGTRVIYTSPIKTLSNQKFHDFKQKFESVGLITGDIQINPDAQCIIMTTEILRNLVYKNSEILRDTEFIVFDEVHYINDPDRGVIWEESIIMSPKHICFVMLSATIPNALEFCEWVGRTKNRCVYVISTLKRVVPLEFLVYCDSEVFTVEEKPFNETKDKNNLSNLKTELIPFSRKTKIINRFRINDLGNFINNRGLIPAIFFCFSKKTCEEYGNSLQNLDLTSHSDKNLIEKFLKEAINKLREEDRFLPQVKKMCDQAYRGVGVHHGALLPFVKECIEILFSMNILKILIATETFAMGVNMPAKCVAFTSLTKISNETFRNLTSGEFIQMSGRAGRRGMDKVGTVIITGQRIPNLATIKKVIHGIPSDLKSNFKISFSLILMAMRSNIVVEELIKNSFKENDIQKDFNQDMIELARLENESKFYCEFCPDIIELICSLTFICKENPTLIKKILQVGDLMIAKSNATYKISKILDFGVSVEPIEILIKGKLFNKTYRSKENINQKNLLELPPTLVTSGRQKTIPFGDIIFLVQNDEISFSYGLLDLQHVVTISEIKERFAMIENSRCLNCSNFEKHYFEALKTKTTLQEISSIKAKYSRDSIELINEYTSRYKFLKKHGFIEESITLKGRAAAEVRTVNEVLAVELIFRNVFKDFDVADLISTFSSMINDDDEKTEYYELYDNIKEKASIFEIQFKIFSEDLELLQIPRFQFLNFSMANAVYDWCKGCSLGSIVSKYFIQEGAFVRLILRLDECCREMISVCLLIGDNILEEKFKQASIILKRDILLLPSLYI